jgi:mannose-1-phosphate guanylyltransferase
VTLNVVVNRYLDQLILALQNLNQHDVWSVADVLMRAWLGRKQVFIIGNGGSAATASHMGNDFGKLVVAGQPRFRSLSLTDNVALMTAWANDAAYQDIFAEQLRNLCEADDVLIAISCSGNSPNILQAVQVARELGAYCIGLTGDQGGRLVGMVDLCIKVHAGYIGQQEDVHLALDHLLTSLLREWIEEIASKSAKMPRTLILAAGEGTRLRPLTLTRPKPMLQINGKPLLEHSLNWLHGYGLSDVAINLNYCPEVIVDHFGNGDSTGMHITYSHEDSILGTAGAARKLEDYLRGGTFVVLYGDVLTDLDLASLLRFHYSKVVRDPATGVTLSLYHVPNPTEVGLVGIDEFGRIKRFVEKPRPEEVFTDLANAGVLIVEPHVLQHIPPGTFYDFGLHLLPDLLQKGIPMYGWVAPRGSYILDIGSPEKYAQAQREWMLLSKAQSK